MRELITFFILIAFYSNTFGQNEDEVKRLSYLADAFTNMSSEEHRVQSQTEFELGLKQLLDKGHAIDDDFEIPWITSFTPSDSSFRMFNWEVIGEERSFYSAAIQFADPGLSPVLFTDQSYETGLVTRETLGADEWFGAFYYNIQEVLVDSVRHYLLFGLNRYSKAYNLKVCDVLWFDDGQPQFGAPVFIKENEGSRNDVRKRIILKFSDPANVSFNYDKEAQIISHNHILPIPEQSYEGEALLVQDGTYELYRYDGMKWIYEEYMFEQNLNRAGEDKEESEIPKVKKDLMGRAQKG